MKYFVFTPSENLCNIEIGQEFQLDGDKRWFVLLERNALSCIVATETWWDEVKNFFGGRNVKRDRDTITD